MMKKLLLTILAALSVLAGSLDAKVPVIGISAYSADGVVEAVERDGKKIPGYKDAGGFVFGVQFHPEIMFANGGYSQFLKVFELFVDEARKYSGK